MRYVHHVLDPGLDGGVDGGGVFGEPSTGVVADTRTIAVAPSSADCIAEASS
jgi:hypothetical protein